MLNFGNGDTEFPLPNSAARAWSARSEKEKKNFDKRIVAMSLPKWGEKSYEIYERVKKKVVMSTIFL